MNQKERYYKAVDELFAKIRATQDDKIEQAAAMMADCVANGGCIHLFDTGHIINSELLNRAGGFVLMRRFSYNLNVDSDVRKRDRSAIKTDQEGLAMYALRSSGVLPGDVMVIGSVSGKTPNVIDLALACREFGVKVIAVTSVTYSSQLETPHSCGKRLFELADIVLDNCSPFGDAMLPVEGVEKPFSPASGLAAAYIMWAVANQLLEDLLAKGITPSILGSVNYPENVEFNNALYKRYENEGI